MFAKFQLLLAIFKAIKDPRQTDSIGKAVDTFANPERFRVAMEKVADDPVVWEKVVRREPVAPVKIEDLEKYPPGTLGYGLYRHLTDNALDPNLLPVEIKDAETYVRQRYRMAHDTWHVVCGYSTSIQDELELQGLTFAQIHGPGSALILAIGLFHYVAFKPSELPQVMKAIVRGYWRGSNAKSLLGVDWNLHYHRSIDEVRQMLNLNETSTVVLNESGTKARPETFVSPSSSV